MKRRLLVLTIALLVLAAARPASAIPQWGRAYGVESCTTCHTVVPKLNLRGMDFLARGYRPDPKLDMKKVPTFPASIWLGIRYDDQIARRRNNTYFNKAEIIAGDSIGNQWNYFAEWRVYDEEAQANGTLRDRSGRFEDLWLNWQEGRTWSVTFGQYRPVFQAEPGRKIAISTPALFTTSIAGDTYKRSRLTGLASFAPQDRQPSVSVVYQSIPGEMAMDGLYHNLTLPFVGEFSLPLNSQARRTASFEFQPRLKGVFLETYYRKGWNSIGVHSLIDDDKYLANLLGTTAFGDFHMMGGVGVSKGKGAPVSRITSMLEMEYLPQLKDDAWRPGFGLRLENVSHSGRPVAVVPYVVLAAPNTNELSSLLQIEYFAQGGNERLRMDLSLFW